MDITYRKTRNGQWVAYGPADAITAGTVVTVTKKNGETKEEYIESVGRPFEVNGVKMVYGYIGRAPVNESQVVGLDDFFGGFVMGAEPVGRVRVSDLPAAPKRRKPRGRMCDACGERRGYIEATDMSGLAGLICGVCDRSGGLSFA